MLKIQAIVNKVYQDNKHKNQMDSYNKIKEFSFLPKDENNQRQLVKLNILLNNAYQKVPYYSKLFKEIGLVKNDKIELKNLSEIQKLPILVREIVQKEKENLYSVDMKILKSYKNNTGGSTGEPMIFLQDPHYFTENMANFYLALSWRGVTPYDSQFMLWGANRDTFEGKKPLKAHLNDFLRNRLMFNCYQMSENQMKDFIEKLNIHKPALIISYAQAIYEVAKFAKKNKIKILKQNAIHSAAGTLFDFMREEIEDVFQCKVFNHYGSREAGAIASECSAQDGLHIIMEHSLVEVVNKDGEACAIGEEGEILITTLNNFSMPLIRYKIGDIGVLKEYSKCSCGCTYPKLEGIRGRSLEMIKTLSDQIVLPEYFVCQIGGDSLRNHIKKFQIIQKELDYIVVKIVENLKVTDEHKDDIVDKIHAVMGKECKVEFEFVKDIPKTKTGKYQYVISEL